MMRAERADAVVIGSGAAGAVVAARLAERGAGVVLLEEGPRLAAAGFHGDVRAAVRALYRNGGVMTALGSPPIAVQEGRCVGGSTVVNGGTCFRTPAGVLAAWSERAGRAFAPADLEPYFEEVEHDLNVRTVPEERAFAGERMLVAAARARGDTAGYVKRNVVACQGAGLCALACPTGAKQSMDLTYVPRAERRGCKVLAGTRALRVRVRDGRATGVLAREATTGDEYEIAAEKVFLCAGALHSPLLLRASLGGRAPRATGRHLHLHPGLHVIGILPEPFATRAGPIQATYVMGPNDDYVVFGMQYPPEVLAIMLLGEGVSLAALAAYPRTATVAVMATDRDGRGQVREVRGEALPLYSLGRATADALVRGTAHAAELLFDIGAREVHHQIRGVPVIRSQAEARALARRRPPPSALTPGSVHPMGTCPMGVDPRVSVVDPELAVHGVRDLYVPDASFFPTELGVNPQITIHAFALRCADRAWTR